MRRKKKSSTFKFGYFIYLFILIIIAVAAIIFVNVTLNQYIDYHPNRLLEAALVDIKESSSDGSLWTEHGELAVSKYEPGVEVQSKFTQLLAKDDLKFSSAKWINDSECVYGIEADGFTIAEVKLKTVSEPIQKLFIITMQKYELVSVDIVSHDYTLTLPANAVLGENVFVKINGVDLASEDGTKNALDGSVEYKISGLYFSPEVKITDNDGNTAECTIPKSTDGKIEFENTFYTLKLPSLISVYLDGEKIVGEELEDGRFEYSISMLKKVTVELEDVYGTRIQYNGTSVIPLTYCRIITTENHTVTLDGKSIPAVAVEKEVNPDYKHFEQYVPGFGHYPTYTIVALKKDAQIEVKNEKGEIITLDKTKKFYDLTENSVVQGTDVPAEISAEIDVLNVAQSWSLFMSTDLSFAELSKYLINGSYQYEVAHKYANGIDITFTSPHTLMNPAFTGESVKNYKRLAENCFSVDIKFVKHMLLNSGQVTDDEMNETFYFVKYDDTEDYVDNPTWKLVGMKEIVNNG